MFERNPGTHSRMHDQMCSEIDIERKLSKVARIAFAIDLELSTGSLLTFRQVDFPQAFAAAA